ncbi:hypothetical protein GCM10020001_104180 [Nonomuraea salmonea]
MDTAAPQRPAELANRVSRAALFADSPTQPATRPIPPGSWDHARCKIIKGKSLHALRRDLRYAHGGAFHSPHLTGQSEQACCLTPRTKAWRSGRRHQGQSSSV